MLASAVVVSTAGLALSTEALVGPSSGTSIELVFPLISPFLPFLVALSESSLVGLVRAGVAFDKRVRGRVVAWALGWSGRAVECSVVAERGAALGPTHLGLNYDVSSLEQIHVGGAGAVTSGREKAGCSCQ